MFDEQGRPWIVECNSMPGLYFTEEEKPHMMRLYEALIGVFHRQLTLLEVPKLPESTVVSATML